MDKNKEIKFVGQPIFKQIIDLVLKVNISPIIKSHDSDGIIRHLRLRRI